MKKRPPHSRPPHSRPPHRAPAAPSPAPQQPAAKPPTHWNNVAEWYDTLVGDAGSDYHQHVILPNVLRLLDLAPPKKNRKPPTQAPSPSVPQCLSASVPPPALSLRLLDLACGQGVLCRQLAALGVRTLGVDAAPALIAAAQLREKQNPLGVSYLLADATKLLPLPPQIPPASFHAITIILAIQNITPLSPVWQACHAALAPAGKLVIVMMHPAFRVFKHSDWHWDPTTQTQSRLVRQYLTSSKADIQMRPAQTSAGNPGETTTSFHRPLQAYVNTLGNAGLYIDHLEEWPSHRQPPAGPRFAALDSSRKEIPLFLALRARKI